MDISVFIPSYNQKKYLQEAIESVLAQTLKPVQIIVVDDASPDDSRDLIDSYKTKYPDLFTTIFHEHNLGIGQTRIDALNAVTGDYVTYVDGDDRFLPTKLEDEAKTLIDNPSGDIAFSNHYYMTKDGERMSTWITKTLPPEGNVFRHTFVRDFPRTDEFRMELVPYNAWKEIGFHDPQMRVLEDWDMRIRLTKKLRTVFCNKPLAEIRLHNTGLSKSRAEEKIKVLDLIWIKNKHLLEDLEEKERNYIRTRVLGWKAYFVRRLAKERLGIVNPKERNWKEAVRLYINSCKYEIKLDPDLIAGLILPADAYRWLKNFSIQPNVITKWKR